MEISYIFSKESFLIFQETELSYISGGGNPEKILYVSGSTFPSPKNKKNLL